MKDSYKVNLTLKCATCGSTALDANADKSYVKCESCGREYLGGYDEVVGLNTEEIEKAKNLIKNKVLKDAEAELKKSLIAAFKGSKNIEIR